MSSHHFVREGQEPALFIFEHVPHSSIESLLEWAPYVMVTQDVLEEVLSWGIRIDAILLEREQEEAIQQALQERQLVELVIFEKRSDAFSEGIRYLKEGDQLAVNVTMEAPEAFFSIAASLSSEIPIVLLEPDRRWILVKDSFQKWVPGGSKFLLRNPEQYQVGFTGLHQEGQFLVAEKDGIAGISVPEFMWLAELN